MTFKCPHCEQPIEVQPGIRLPSEPAWLSFTNRPVSLGCGSLFAIAIIVENKGHDGIGKDLGELIGAAKTGHHVVDNLETIILQLQDTVESDAVVDLQNDETSDAP